MTKLDKPKWRYSIHRSGAIFSRRRGLAFVQVIFRAGYTDDDARTLVEYLNSRP